MLWGLDISEEGVRILREQGFDHIIPRDPEEMGSELRRMNCDVVLAGEILEHVGNVGLFPTQPGFDHDSEDGAGVDDAQCKLV